jgi:membrane-associated phospholipid phosphatase
LADAAADLSWFERWERDVVHAFTCTWYGPFLEGLSRAVESKVLPVVLLVLALAWVARTRWRTAVRALFAAAVGFGLAMLLATAMWSTIDRARPQEAYAVVLRSEAEWATCASRPEALALRSGGSTSRSFPSRHGLTVGVFATVLWLVSRRMGVAAALYGLAVCIQRLTSGKHWPSDLIVGVVLGVGLGWLAWRACPPLARRLGLPAAEAPAISPPGPPDGGAQPG